MHWVVTEQTDPEVYDYDLRTGKCNWTGAIEEVTGYSFEKLKELGEYFWSQNIHRADTSYMDKKLQDMRITEGRFNEEASLINKDGTCIYIENSGICLTDYEKRPYGAIGILTDITSIILADRKDQVIHFQNEVINNEENINVRTRGTLQDIDEHKIKNTKIVKLY
jgi:PAS domain S-box-containing protein